MKHIIRHIVKRPKISKHEIIADVIFLAVAMFLSFLAIYIFDIHWSFYPGNTIFPPNKHIFQTPEPYYVGVPLGGIIGFLIIKILFFAFIEEEEAINEIKKENETKKKEKSKR